MAWYVIVLVVLLFISGAGLVAFILMHSGKGTGVSDMIAASLYASQNSTGLIEKNLDRFTIICAVVFMVTLIILMIVYPHGTFAAISTVATEA